MARRDLAGLGAVERLEHGVTLGGQDAARSSTHAVLVLDEQDGLAARRAGGQRNRAVDLGAPGQDARQVDSHRRTLVRRARDVDEAAALGDDPVDAREPEPRSHALLCREERLEDPGARDGIHSAAGVGDGENDVRPRCLVRRNLLTVHVRGRDRQRAASRHGVPRVQGKVDQHLLDLAGIRLHVTEVGGERGHHLDLLPDQAAEHLVGVDDDRVQVDDARLQHLLAPEGEQLLRQRRSALCRLLDRLHVRPQADLVRVEAAEQEAAVHGDHGQQVVEVVSDATGETADCVELLRLVQALLELLAVADVVHHPNGELGVAVRVAHDRRRHMAPHDLAVGAAVALLERVALALSADELLEQLVSDRGLFARGEIRQLSCRRAPRWDSPSISPNAWLWLDDATGGVGEADPHRRRLVDRAEAPLAPVQQLEQRERLADQDDRRDRERHQVRIPLPDAGDRDTEGSEHQIGRRGSSTKSPVSRTERARASRSAPTSSRWFEPTRTRHATAAPAA